MKNCISILSLKFVSSAKNNQEHALINKHLLGRCSWPWILRNTVPIHVRFTWNEKIWALSLPIVNGIKSLHDVQMFVFIIKKGCVLLYSLSPNSHFFLVYAVSIIVLRNKCQLFWEKQMVQLNFKGCIFNYLILVLFLTKLAFPMFSPVGLVQVCVKFI